MQLLTSSPLFDRGASFFFFFFWCIVDHHPYGNQSIIIKRFIFLINCQIILVAYVYGVDKFLSNIAEMKMKLSRVTKLYWKARSANLHIECKCPQNVNLFTWYRWDFWARLKMLRAETKVSKVSGGVFVATVSSDIVEISWVSGESLSTLKRPAGK